MNNTAKSRFLRQSVTVFVLTVTSGCARYATGTFAGPDLTTEGGSLTGHALVRPPLTEANRTRLTAQLMAASDTLRMNPNSADALIWVGRRLAYLAKYREAIDTFSAGVTRFPNDVRFLRHRGHRYLTIRRPMLAERDFAQAAAMVQNTPDEVEPDGAPNAANIPVSTLQHNIYYHQALAYYVQYKYPEALNAWNDCARVAVTPDAKVSCQYWRYIVLKRLSRDAEADSALNIGRENPKLIENQAYLNLIRLFAGLENIETVYPSEKLGSVVDGTTAYGVSMWYYFRGDRGKARDIWKRLDASPAWSSFGVLAAEAELTRRP